MPRRDVERWVFEKFLVARRLTYLPDELEQPDAPAPDISWRRADAEHVAFELTEVVEQAVASHLAVNRAARLACWEEFERLVVDEKSRLNGRFYSVRLHPNVGMQHVIRVCRQVLRALPPRAAEFGAVEHVELSVQVEGPESPVQVGVSGPCGFTSFSLGWMGTWQESKPTLRAVQTKLGKRYSCNGALELLAYFSKQHSGSFDREDRAALDARFASRSACAPFRRIWVFDARRGAILAVYPPGDAVALGVELSPADPGQ